MNKLFAYSPRKDKMGASTEEHDVIGYKAVSDNGDQIGTVRDYILDESGHLRYLVVETGFWVFGKRVLVPVGMSHIEDRRREVIFSGLSKQKVEEMPAYDESEEISPDYECSVMDCYYPGQETRTGETGRINYDSYNAFRTPERLQLLEERLQVDKRQELQGEATIRKRVETHMETVEVPVNRERLVIDTHPVGETGMTEEAGTARSSEIPEGAFGEQEAIKVPLYSEEVQVTKRPYVREEVTVRKEQDTETRTVQENVRSEQLDIDNPVEQQRGERRRGTPRQPDQPDWGGPMDRRT